MELHYLDFDSSGDDDQGQGSFEAMAGAAPHQWPALEAEVRQVLDWAHAAFGPAAAIEDGGEWDYALHGVREVATPLQVHYRAGADRLALEPGAADPPRVTLTLTLTGTPAFCAALREAFGLA